MARPENGSAPDKRRTGRSAAAALVHGVDLVVTLVILVVCGILYYVTTTFDEMPPTLGGNITPQWFPRLLIWSIAILALALPFEHLFVQDGHKKLDDERSNRIKPITLMSAGLLVIVVASIEIVGMPLAMVLVCALLPLLWGERRLKILIPFAILFPAAVTLLFSKVLNIYFEPGLLGIAFG